MKKQVEKVIQVKPIPGFEGLYSATCDGRIYRHANKKVKPGFLIIERNTAYLRVPLFKDGLRTWHHVHRLVAAAFIPNPEEKPQVNHKNFNKHDNKVENLEWVTRRENWQHARDNGVFTGNMISENEQIELYHLYTTGKYTYQQLAKKFGISLSSVGRHITKHRNLRSAA